MVTPVPHPIFSTPVGGRLSLDFVNTVRARMARRDDRPEGRPLRLKPADEGAVPDFQDVIAGERLTDAGAMLEWATWIGVLSRAEGTRLATQFAAHPREGAALHARVVRLREAIYRLGKASLEGWAPPADDLAVLTREWQRARAHDEIVASPVRGGRRGRSVYRVVPRADDHIDHWLWPIVADAVALLTGDEVARLGQCPASGCGWLFLDTSRSGRRQWCDMAVCGNADKVRRYRERQHARRARASS